MLNLESAQIEKERIANTVKSMLSLSWDAEVIGNLNVSEKRKKTGK